MHDIADTPKPASVYRDGDSDYCHCGADLDEDGICEDCAFNGCEQGCEGDGEE